MHLQEGVNLAITSLNSLFSGRDEDGAVQFVSSLDELNLVQRDAMVHIIRRVRSFGGRPLNASRAGALQALRIACSPYGGDSTGVGDVVPMRLGILSVPEVGVEGVDISGLLDGRAGEFLRNPEGQMLQDAGNWGILCEEMAKLRTYNDPQLKHRSRALSMPYCDNTHVLATDPEVAQRGMGVFRSAYDFAAREFTRRNEEFEEVPSSMLSVEGWKVAKSGKWMHTKEHITLKEGGAVAKPVGGKKKVAPPGRRAQVGLLTELEQKSISTEQEAQYSSYLRRFKDFCKESGLVWPLRGKVDETLADYFDVLYLDGQGVNAGEKTLAAVEFYFHAVKGKMMRSRRALRGWRKVRPPRSRLPLPRTVVFGIAMRMIFQGHRDKALMILLSFDAYLRPGEAADLVARNLVPPVRGTGKQYQLYTLVVREEDEGVPDKTGIFSSSIPMDNPSTKNWLGPAIQRLGKHKKANERLFDFNEDSYRAAFKSASNWLGLGDLHTYQLRHGGASEDLLGGVREYQVVKERGRWRTDTSVRRYAKVGKIQALLNRLAPWAIQFCKRAEAKMEEVITGKLAAFSA
ncbi:unnamed protein product [Effrenium voratum]|nr:unnamed protein product [Effrenium voratum]